MSNNVKMALVGNPNVGKTSLYNRFTHSFEHVGNWHGVTVEQKSKTVLYDDTMMEITDLPGLYSLTVYSPEEAISRDNLLYGENNVVLAVCEVNNLARNLYLTLQLLELNVPIILVINMVDELKKQGNVLNYRKLEQYLKVPIVPTSTKYHSDIHLLQEVAIDYISSNRKNITDLPYLEQLPIEKVKLLIAEKANQAGLDVQYCAIKVLEKDSFVLGKLALTASEQKILDDLGDTQALVAKARYEYIDKITEGVVRSNVRDEHGEIHEHLAHKVPLQENIEVSDPELIKHKKHHDEHENNILTKSNGYSKADRVLLNKFWALPIFFLIMAGIFVITFGVVGPFFSWLLDMGIENLIYKPLTTWLNSVGTMAWIVALIGDGIILGVGGILTFLPQVVLLFFFLALLEDSGYISRVAFMTDGIFRKIGLSGRSAFSMLMGFGCSATAVLTARGLEDDMMRKKTVLLTPFMSCSARLPVYAIIASSFFAQGQPFIIFGLYIFGVIVALLLAFIMEKFMPKMKSGKLSFIMEMPPYRFPTAVRVLQIIWNNTKVFLIRVGTVVFALNVIVWILSNFTYTFQYVPLNDGTQSILEMFSTFIAPVFAPLGFGNWRAVTALMSGLVAKEVVISSIESLGGVSAVFVGEFASLSAFSFLVFTLLYVPCIATLSAIGKELGAKWACYSLGLTMGIAYVFSCITYWVLRLFAFNLGLAIGILLVSIIAIYCAIVIVKLVKRRFRCVGCESDCSKCLGLKNKGKNINKTDGKKR